MEAEYSSPTTINAALAETVDIAEEAFEVVRKRH
jgi:hypothetical protein